jgi:hypothetical protein
MNKLVLALAALLALPATARAQAAPRQPPAATAADSAAIRRAALDYIEGWYTGDAARMRRALHPELAKRYLHVDEKGESWIGNTTAETLIHQTQRALGTDVPVAERRADPRILDIYGNLASVRLESARLVDYMHLVRWNGEWKIINVLWDLLPQPGKP